MEDHAHDDVTGTIELTGPMLHLKWAPGAVVRESDAKALMERARSLSGGRVLPLLVEITGMAGIDQRALKAFAERWPITRAAIIGSSPVDEALAGFYTGRHNPEHPTRFFTSTDDAVAWLWEDTSAAGRES